MIRLGVANSSPLIALGRINRLPILMEQFERLVVPSAVAEEVGKLPPGIIVEHVQGSEILAAFPPRIHHGESEVILLGIQNPAAIIVLDDWYARQFAKSRGLNVLGTIGLVLRSKRLGMLEKIEPVLAELMSVGFHISPKLRAEALHLAGEA